MYQKRLVILMPLLINEGDFKVRNVTETLNLDLNNVKPGMKSYPSISSYQETLLKQHRRSLQKPNSNIGEGGANFSTHP